MERFKRIKEKKTGNIHARPPIKVNCIDFSKWILDNLVSTDRIILKLDIEGAEYEIIDSLPERYFDKIENIIMEYHFAFARTALKYGLQILNKSNIKKGRRYNINDIRGIWDLYRWLYKKE